MDEQSADFHLLPDSPCRNSGRYSRDRGALPFESTDIGEERGLSIIAGITSYPNPFNSGTTVSFMSPSAMDMTIKIYDQLGRLVIDLGKRYCMAGNNSVTLNFDGLASGIYYCNIRSLRFSLQLPLLHLR